MTDGNWRRHRYLSGGRSSGVTLRDAFDAPATHRVFVGPDAPGRLADRAETAVVRAVAEHGTEARVAADWDAVDAASVLSRRPERSALYEDGERVLSLSDDADALDALLAAATDDDVGRLATVRALAVLDGDRPCYHTVPHELHVRELFDGSGVVDAASGALAGVDGVAVFPVGPLVAWTVDGVDCALAADSLSVDGRSWQLSRLERVTADGGGLRLAWRSTTETATDAVQYVVGRVYDAFAASPPDRVAAPSEAVRGDVLRTIERLREELGYGVRVGASR